MVKWCCRSDQDCVGLFLCNAITFKTNQKRKDYWKVWKVSFVDNRVWYNFIFLAKRLFYDPVKAASFL